MLNKVQIIGRLGADPEVRATSGGQAVTKTRIATTETWKKDGQKQEKTEWHNVVFFGKVAEIAGDFLKKGSLCYVEGKLQTRSYEGKSGETIYVTEIVASEMKMLSGSASGGRDNGRQQTGSPYDDGPF